MLHHEVNQILCREGQYHFSIGQFVEDSPDDVELHLRKSLLVQ